MRASGSQHDLILPLFRRPLAADADSDDKQAKARTSWMKTLQHPPLTFRSPLRRRLAPLYLLALLAVFVFFAAGPGQQVFAASHLRPHRVLRPAMTARTDLAGLENLVIVAGHAVYTNSDFRAAHQESSWYLEDYQRIPGYASTLLDHMRAGVAVASADPAALLLFSGGETRGAAGPLSEAQSYWLVSNAASWFGHSDARDSLENVLFSLCRFFELTGRYPMNVTVVSFDMKEARFLRFHRVALRLPESRFRFVGTPAVNREAATSGEQAVVASFTSDPYGCSGALAAKRAQRDPFANGAPYGGQCPALEELMAYCGPSIYPGKLPWN